MVICPGRGGAHGRGLLTNKEAPEYSLSAGIETGYRAKLDYYGCLGSIFRIHNETVNIWTHLVGSIFFLYLLLLNLTTDQAHHRDWQDQAASLLQLSTYTLALLSSGLFHTFLCHSQEAHRLWLGLDQAGILLALLGTYVRLLVTVFHCFPALLTGHLAAVLALFGSVPLLLRPGGLPVPLLLGIALYAVLPLGHWAAVAGSRGALPWLALPYLQGGLGVALYLGRAPECLVPGRADIWGASHQLWHGLILTGMGSWYYLAAWLSTRDPPGCGH